MAFIGMEPENSGNSIVLNKNKLDKSQKEYVLGMMKDVSSVQAEVTRMSDGSFVAEELTQLKALLHRITSSAGAYGFERHARIANMLEHVIESAEMDGFDTVVTQLLSVKTNELLALTKEASDALFDDKDQVSLIANTDLYWSITTVFIGDFAPLSHTLQMKSYRSMCIGFDELRNLKVRPLNLVVKQSDIETDFHAAEKFQTYLERLWVKPKVIFLTEDRSPQAILEGLDLGGDCFLSCNDIEQHLLDHHEDDGLNDDLKIAILDDDHSIVNSVSSSLNFLGIKTTSSRNVSEFIETATLNLPDLFVIDMNLESQLTGIDVVKYLRNHEMFSFYPIILLTSDTREETAYLARNMGADDVLHKPIDERNFSSIVAHKLIKSRRLTRRIRDDFLTGLLKKKAFEDALQSHLTYLKRNRSTLTLILLDIKGLKRINDENGYLHGDDVLKQLSNILRKRLRASDIIGRLHGEKFVIALPDTSEEDANLVMSDLLYRFSSHVFEFPEKTEQFSFVWAASAFPQCASVSDLIAQAEESLVQKKYLLKNSG